MKALLIFIYSLTFGFGLCFYAYSAHPKLEIIKISMLYSIFMYQVLTSVWHRMAK